MAEVTVITVVRNHSQGLKATYESLLLQSITDWIMIIVIGASSDDTLELANELAKNDVRVHLVLQSGLGIYSAMNQGLELTATNFVWFMNAGDRFSQENAIKIGTSIMIERKADLIVGGYQVKVAGVSKRYTHSLKSVSSKGFAFNRRSGCHQAMIFSTKVIQSMGGYATSYVLASDFDLVLRMTRSYSVMRVPHCFTIIEPGGVADSNIRQVHEEKHEIRKLHFQNKSIAILSLMWKIAATIKIETQRKLMKQN